MSNSDSSNVVKHAGYMPGSPSMDQPGDLAASSDALSGGAAGTDIVSNAGQRPAMGSPSMSGDPDGVGTHIMETGIDYDYPSDKQGSMEPTRNGSVRGT